MILLNTSCNPIVHPVFVLKLESLFLLLYSSLKCGYGFCWKRLCSACLRRTFVPIDFSCFVDVGAMYLSMDIYESDRVDFVTLYIILSDRTPTTLVHLITYIVCEILRMSYPKHASQRLAARHARLMRVRNPALVNINNTVSNFTYFIE